MTKYAAVLFLVSVSLAAEVIRTAPPDLKKLGDVDLTTLKPLVITQDGIFECKSGYDLYVRSRDTKGEIVKVNPLAKTRIR